jgi:hypothetical protein
MGGIGKTAIAAKVAAQIQYEFEYVIWRSLRNAPPLEPLSCDLVAFASDFQETSNAQVSKLILLTLIKNTDKVSSPSLTDLQQTSRA